MNIFVLDYDPVYAAKYHCNKHLIKMILESCQLMSTAHHVLGGGGPLRQTHTNHPCSKWVRESTENYDWLHNLTIELCKEYTFRYNKVHKYEREGVLASLKQHPFMLMRVPMTSFAQAMPDEYKHIDAVTAYRTYYLKDKFEILDYKNRDMPYWVKDYIEQGLHLPWQTQSKTPLTT